MSDDRACLVCGAGEDEADSLCPLFDEDADSDAWEEDHCLALDQWWIGMGGSA